MKKSIYYFSFLVDLVSILLILIYILKTNLAVDRLFLAIYIIFIALYMYDKFKRENLKKGLLEYKLNSNSDLMYYVAFIGAVVTDINLIYFIYSKIDAPNTIVLLVLFYFICLTNYDVDAIYYDKKNIVYSNRKVELEGIKTIEDSKRLFINKLNIYYVKKDPVLINTFSKEKLSKVKNFIKEKMSTKRKKK